MTDNTPWSYTFNFILGEQGFTPITSGVYVNNRWETRADPSYGNRMGVELTRSLPNAQIISIRFIGYVSAYRDDDPRIADVFLLSSAVWTGNGNDPSILSRSSITALGNFDQTFAVNDVGVNGCGITCITSAGTPVSYITSVVLIGSGNNPFLNDYCVACAINHIGIDIEEALDGFAGL